MLRIDNNNNLFNSKPCYHCMLKLMKSNNVKINNVFYSIDDGIVCVKFDELCSDIELSQRSSNHKINKS